MELDSLPVEVQRSILEYGMANNDAGVLTELVNRADLDGQVDALLGSVRKPVEVLAVWLTRMGRDDSVAADRAARDGRVSLGRELVGSKMGPKLSDAVAGIAIKAGSVRLAEELLLGGAVTTYELKVRLLGVATTCALSEDLFQLVCCEPQLIGELMESVDLRELVTLMRLYVKWANSSQVNSSTPGWIDDEWLAKVLGSFETCWGTVDSKSWALVDAMFDMVAQSTWLGPAAREVIVRYQRSKMSLRGYQHSHKTEGLALVGSLDEMIKLLETTDSAVLLDEAESHIRQHCNEFCCCREADRLHGGSVRRLAAAVLSNRHATAQQMSGALRGFDNQTIRQVAKLLPVTREAVKFICTSLRNVEYIADHPKRDELVALLFDNGCDVPAWMLLQAISLGWATDQQALSLPVNSCLGNRKAVQRLLGVCLPTLAGKRGAWEAFEGLLCDGSEMSVADALECAIAVSTT